MGINTRGFLGHPFSICKLLIMHSTNSQTIRIVYIYDWQFIPSPVPLLLLTASTYWDWQATLPNQDCPANRQWRQTPVFANHVKAARRGGTSVRWHKRSYNPASPCGSGLELLLKGWLEHRELKVRCVKRLLFTLFLHVTQRCCFYRGTLLSISRLAKDLLFS